MPITPARLALIGLGLHASKAYLPALATAAEVDLVAVVDLNVCRRTVEARLAPHLSRRFSPSLVGVDGFDGPMPDLVRESLDAVVREKRIDAVIISTEPESHGAYLRWAIENRLSVLIDKPILGAEGATRDPAVGPALLREFEELAGMAADAHVLVSVAVQRRWHPGFLLMRNLVGEAADRFGCPITHISSSHADGQLRLPHEIGTVAYHGYDRGYGKLFHSGYHEIDLQAWLISHAARRAGVVYDGMCSTAATIRPAGFLRQIPRERWERIFGAEAWADACPEDDELLVERYGSFGEIDVSAMTTFEIQHEPALIATVDLQHNSFTRRSWITPRSDWYKGQGRVKHEQHTIHQGPFQTIHVTSWQAKDQHGVNSAEDYEPGGNSHFTVDVFRNADLWPKGTPPMQTITATDIAASAGLSSARLLMSHSKDAMLAEFLGMIRGTVPPHVNPSPLTSHWLGAAVLSAIASSMASGRSVTTTP